MTKLASALKRATERLRPHRDAILDDWVRALVSSGSENETEVREGCARSLDALLVRLSTGDVEGLLAEEGRSAGLDARRGASSLIASRAIRALNRCLIPHVVALEVEPEALVETLGAFDDLATRRLEALLAAQEDESARRLVEAQEQAARATERAREGRRTNEALRRAQAQSHHRAEQIGLLASVAHRVAPIREPEELMQQAADTVRARMNHTYVAVVVLDGDGALLGRWSGRPGIGRQSSGRAEGPPGGLIGRTIRLRSPQVVGDVTDDPDYHPDVPGTRSEMVIPLLEGAEVLGVLDFQSEHPYAFALDDVAAGEILAEFLVIALQNARLFQEARGRNGGGST
jgi:putative methionine-R-sulfoxide reductase with GAF domain